MTIETFVLAVTVLLIAYFTARRWVVMSIFANLVSGTLANPLRAQQIERLLAKRDQLEARSASEDEIEKNEDSIAGCDPMCEYGRRDLLQAAWSMYAQCRWTKPKLD